LNVIINTAHQSGSMTDYIDQTFGEQFEQFETSVGMLHYLSNIPQKVLKSWDRDLERFGMLPDIDYSAIKRRQAREEARGYLLEAWKSLVSKTKQKLRKNPRTIPVKGLQKAVIRELRRAG